ncbi:hypothetical protein [Streptomyces sp. I05A-00742]|uniref:hypothetical protein n=1 Tax=Streptomyces sp. I05A-00742 TaxID=2732853 RepID=UPI001487A735|nr:hypothetical protein [Streptomyces sp. I05A-00742]
MNVRKRIALASAALALGGGLVAAGPASGAFADAGPGAAVGATRDASAAAKANCQYPNVCFIKNGRTIASYKDRGYQKLGSKARSAREIYNSRKDDGAKVYFVHTSGKKATACFRPKARAGVGAGWTAYAIDIRNSPTCK